MNTPTLSRDESIARVAIDVRLYFDVPVVDLDEEQIRRAARDELERVADDERIRVKLLKHPAIYPTDDWPTLKPADFAICDICPAREVNSENRFPL